MIQSTVGQTRGWLRATDCSLKDFAALVEQTTDLAEYPFADDARRNVLIYGRKICPAIATHAGRAAVQTELIRALTDGPGIVVFQAAFDDLAVVDRVTEAFLAQIAEEKAAGFASGDHFAKPGTNDRVWGALDKLAVKDPDAFADYYANEIIALVSQAWLGPGYQLTSQVNVVNPGGLAQRAHRDYHLGFMDSAGAVRFPAHVHRLGPSLTLQGAIAHCDMPVETGPTLYLPYSQQYEAGYVAFHLPEFTEYFERNHTQLPLEKGDAVFFNPAVFHGAGMNLSASVKRMANLLQVSSPFGRAMESVDRVEMSRALYPVLLQRKATGSSQAYLDNVVAAFAEGYAFPTNLDRDQPIGGLSPQTQAELVQRAVSEGWLTDRFENALVAQVARTLPGPG